jgi:hypothetical protein
MRIIEYLASLPPEAAFARFAEIAARHDGALRCLKVAAAGGTRRRIQ